jgi:hypothetical protein
MGTNKININVSGGSAGFGNVVQGDNNAIEGTSVAAGGDVIGGDKSVTTVGFQQEQDKQEFIQQIEQLRAALRSIKSEIEADAGLDEDDKDAITMEILQQIGSLKAAKEEATDIELQQDPPQDKIVKIEGYLNAALATVEKVESLGETVENFATTIAPYVKLSLPLILSARHLFGLP